MAQIHPFGGFRYDISRDGELASLIAPPYDVLSKSEVAALHEVSPHNISHLTRPESYGDAGRLWGEWRESGVVSQDAPSFYHYTQSFDDPETGQAIPARTGLICALELEEYGTGGVLPHENTIAAHRADRLELMRATHANLESIYGLYADPTGEARSALMQAAELPIAGQGGIELRQQPCTALYQRSDIDRRATIRVKRQDCFDRRRAPSLRNSAGVSSRAAERARVRCDFDYADCL